MYELILEIFHAIPPVFSTTLGYCGIVVMVYGAFKALYQFGGNAVANQRCPIEIVRLEFGQHIALGLEFLLGKDLIATIIEPSWDDLGKLAIIIILRTVLTHFLSQELEKLEHDEHVYNIALRRRSHRANHRKTSK